MYNLKETLNTPKEIMCYNNVRVDGVECPCVECPIKSLTENKCKLNMNTSDSCAVVRNFSSSSVLSPKLLFFSEKPRNAEKSLLNLNLEVPSSCSEKSEKIFSGLEILNQCISKDISVNNLEEPSNIISTGKYDNCNINYSEKFVNIVQNSNSASVSRHGLLEKADWQALSSFNSNCKNLFSSSKKPNIVIDSFNSTSELISCSRDSSNELMSRETLVDK